MRSPQNMVSGRPMKNLWNFKCFACGWIHFGTTEEDAQQAVVDFNRCYSSLQSNEQLGIQGPALIETY